MSAYTAGIGADYSAEKAAAEKELTTLNKELGAAIKKAAQTFPAKFTALQAATLLDNAAQWGTKQRARFGGNIADALLSIIGRPANTSGLTAAITKADDEQKRWRGKIPFVGDGYVYEKGKNKEWAEVNGQVMRVYVEAGGLIGERVSLNQSKAELKKDVKDNAKKAFEISGGVVVAAGIVAAVVLLKKGK